VKIIRARTMGMCFGVQDALEVVTALDSPQGVAIYGQLVHNPEVCNRLKELGIHSMEEKDRSREQKGNELLEKDISRIVITAHGISDRERNVLEEKGKTLIDTTCPLVRRVHELAKNFQKLGYFVVVTGKKDHVEIKGLVGDLENYAVVERPEDVRRYPTEKIGMLCQTTMCQELLEKIYAKVVRKNFGKEIHFVNTICRPTRDRQEAVQELLEEVDALVVVGGLNSNNTQQLAALAEKEAVPCFCVEKADELKKEWFDGFSAVGLTAGASTLLETVEEVNRWLVSLNETQTQTASLEIFVGEAELDEEIREFYASSFQEGK
jgi:4-hydroxy-3-methylbut-2-en-1-yl diphosphate reductase